MHTRFLARTAIVGLWSLVALTAGCGSPSGPSISMSGLSPGSVVLTPGGAIVGTSVTFESKGAYIYAAGMKANFDTTSMTFIWHFGDGGSATGATVTHTYATTGSFRPSVTINDGMGRSATASLSVSVKDLTDTWYPDQAHPLLGGHPRMTFTQNGFNLSGTYADDSGSGTVAGTISTTGVVTLTVSVPGIAPITFTGTPGPGTNTLDGLATEAGVVSLRWVMFRPDDHG